MPLRRVPFWLDRFPKSRRPSYPRFRGHLDSAVVIVGGGLTGASCAWSFSASGVKAVLLEAARVGTGTTGGSSGLIREDFDAWFGETAANHGMRAARVLWQGMRRASLDFAAAVRRLQLRCDLTPQELIWFAPRHDAEAIKRLRREYQARREAGLEHTWLTAASLSRHTALSGGGAILTRGAAFDPYRACLGLAAAAVSRGAQVFEQSPVRRIRAGRKLVEITTDAGSLRAEAVVIATGAPLPDLRALRRHLRPEHAYAVVTEPLPAAVRREVGRRTMAVRDSAMPPHFLRWLKEDRVLFVGADQPHVPPRSREKVLVQRTGQLMYELSVLYPPISGAMPEGAWDLAHEGTVDGLPFVGVHRNFPRHLFALGQGRHGAGVSWLAARLLLRHFLADPAKGDELFGFGRIL